VVQVKALACELPATHGLPLSHWNTPDIARQVCQSGLVASISDSTIWRWLDQDAIRPWYHRSWIFPRDRPSCSPSAQTPTGPQLESTAPEPTTRIR